MNKSAIVLILTAYFLLPGLAKAGFIDNGNGTVTDTITNLMWQQCSDGLSGTGCGTGAVAIADWESAISYCEGLSLGGFTDWRLPKIKELQSIVDMTCATTPAINATYFPNTQSALFWSSTTYAAYTPYAWFVGFNDGVSSYFWKTSSLYVRCVRGQ